MVIARDDDEAPQLPAEWDDIDLAIFDARIRQGLSWRQVGERVNISFSSARQRFYRRMAKVTPAEVSEMRVEENFKLDEREQRALSVFAQAMIGKPIRYQGTIVYELRDGETHAVMERDLDGALGALRELDRAARARYKLNGLEAPIKLLIEDLGSPASEMAAALDAYLQGLNDGAVGDRADVAQLDTGGAQSG